MEDTTRRTALIGLVALVVGIGFGLLYGYVIDPVKWINQPMTATRGDLQLEYMRMTIDSFRVNGNQGDAVRRYQDLGANAPALLDTIVKEPGALDPGAVAAFQQLIAQSNVQLPAGDTTNQDGSGGSPIGTILIVGSVLAIVILLGAGAFWLFRTNRRSGAEMTPAMQAAELSRSVEKTDYTTSGEQPPVAQYVTTYVLGDDLFDDSFSIDAPSGEFLGECGVGISETIGVGDPKKVTAFEVWMFDKNDIQTVTKVLMSPHAFSDPSYRSKLEPKGELVQVEQHKQVILETQTLQMTATVSDMQYGQGALPDGSYFDRMTLELAIWSKK